MMSINHRQLFYVFSFAILLIANGIRIGSTNRNRIHINKNAIKPYLKNLKTMLSTFIFCQSCLLNPSPSYSFGPTELQINILNYNIVELCNGQKPIMPGQKAAEGLFPVCVEVEAEITNPQTSGTLSDASVYGFVQETAAGNSVLPNNPDFRSDAGQYAMIKTVPAGKSIQKFQFVAAISQNPKNEVIPPFKFTKTKGMAFPGGEKFKPLGICEIDPRAEECDDDEDL